MGLHFWAGGAANAREAAGFNLVGGMRGSVEEIIPFNTVVRRGE
jgi:hypothetical protein